MSCGAARVKVLQEGTHRQILPTKRALAQVDAAPSVFTTWGPLGAHIPVGEPVTFHIHARDRDGTLLETFTDAEAFTLSVRRTAGRGAQIHRDVHRRRRVPSPVHRERRR